MKLVTVTIPTVATCTGKEVQEQQRMLNSDVRKIKAKNSGSRKVVTKRMVTRLDTTIVHCIGVEDLEPLIMGNSDAEVREISFGYDLKEKENGRSGTIIVRYFCVEIQEMLRMHCSDVDSQSVINSQSR